MNNKAPISSGQPKGTGQGFAFARWVEFNSNTFGWQKGTTVHGWNSCRVCKAQWLNMQHKLLRSSSNLYW